MELRFSNKISTDQRLYVNLSKHHGWNGYFYAGTEKLPEELDLNDTWNAKGQNSAYLFCQSAPKNSAAFVEKLETFLTAKSDARLFCLWIKNTEADFDEQNIDCLSSDQNTAGNLINKDASILIGNFIWLSILKNCFIQLNEEKCQLEIKRGFAGSDFTFYNNSLLRKSKTGEKICIPFSGVLSGAFCFPLTIQGAKGLYDYRTGLQYYDGQIKSALQYEIFSPDHQDEIHFLACIDPLDQYNINEQRTFLAFKRQDAIPSCFRSIYGEQIKLEPVIEFSAEQEFLPSTDSAKLVLQQFEKGNADSAYTVPQGNFYLRTEKDWKDNSAQNKSLKILCGLSGVEYIECRSKTIDCAGSVMRFTPNYPAKYDLTSDEIKTKHCLQKDFLTAWVSIFDANDCEAKAYYISQPENGALYAPDAAKDKILTYLPCKTAELSEEHIFPIACYCEINQEKKEFEKKALSQARYKEICQQATLPITANSGITRLSTTLQGLLAEIDEATGQWKSLTLALNQLAGQKNYIKFLPDDDRQYLHPHFITAFQNNSMFLVISENKDKTLGTFQNKINIEDWMFSFDVPTNSSFGNYANVLIIKFCPGTIKDLAPDTKQWTNPERFNNAAALPMLSQWISDYITSGIEQYETDGNKEFKQFAEIVQDPTYQGILVLKANINASSFPSKLKGLLGGLDRSRFYAHHFGINVNRVEQDENGQLAMNQNSSMYALIHYLDAGFENARCNVELYRGQKQAANTQDFDFLVLSLTVSFQNSKINSFGCLLCLTINRLFQSAINASDKENILILKGNLERQGNDYVYSFQNEGANMISLSNSILSSLMITKTSFQTLSDEKELIVSSFSLNGMMAFTKLEFDLFSYGGEDSKDAQKGLAFTNLNIQMSFSLDDADKKTYLFCPELMSFDNSLSSVRKDSLFHHFPLKFKNLLIGSKDLTLSDQGFVVIDTPDLKDKSIGNDWHGLNFILDLGSLGELAAAGGFEAELMALWQGEQAAAAIKLSGITNQSKSFSLNGVLKLEIEKIKLLQAKTQEGKTAYLLMMNEICLKLLGLTFPKDAAIDFYIFGDPKQSEESSGLSWYAAYQREEKRG